MWLRQLASLTRTAIGLTPASRAILMRCEKSNQIVVDRVSTGTESPGRQTLSEFSRQLEAGLEADGGPPPSFDVPVHLSDLDIRITRGYIDPPPSRVRFGDTAGSHDAIVLSFTMKPGQNITFFGEAVDQLLATANHTFLPPDIKVQKVSNPPEFVQKKVSDVVSNLMQAIVLVLVILGLMAGIRVAMVTAVTIPLIVLTSIALMRIWHVEIEQISLAALIVALGLLVDNSIVTSENTSRFLNEGMSQAEAVTQGCNSVSSSLLWSSFTTIGVFIPMAFVLPGDLGEYIFSLPVVVTLTLLISWLCAMTLTPILSYYMLKPTDGRLPIVTLAQWIFQRLGLRRKGSTTYVDSEPASAASAQKESGYITLCRWAIRMRFDTIGVAFALLAAAIMLPVPSSFFPFSDRNQFVDDVWLPETTPIYHTDELTRQVEAMVRRLSTTTWKDGEWIAITDEKGQLTQWLDSMATYVVSTDFLYKGIFR